MVQVWDYYELFLGEVKQSTNPEVRGVVVKVKNGRRGGFSTLQGVEADTQCYQFVPVYEISQSSVWWVWSGTSHEGIAGGRDEVSRTPAGLPHIERPDASYQQCFSWSFGLWGVFVRVQRELLRTWVIMYRRRHFGKSPGSIEEWKSGAYRKWPRRVWPQCQNVERCCTIILSKRDICAIPSADGGRRTKETARWCGSWLQPDRPFGGGRRCSCGAWYHSSWIILTKKN